MQTIFTLRGSRDAAAFAGNFWRCRAGEQWVIRGSNGSGKSLLASFVAEEVIIPGVILEIAPAYEGRLALASFAQQQAHAAESWLQARWHSSCGFDAMKVSDFLSYEEINAINPFEVRDPELAARRVFAAQQKHISEIFRLAPLWQRFLYELSNGEMRRLLLAGALLKDPRVLILDDPFAGLDISMRRQLGELLSRLPKRDITLIMTVRHADEIPACITHCLTLEDCRIKSRKTFSPAEKPAGNPAASDRKIPRKKSRDTSCAAPVIEMRDVTIRFDDRVVLDRLNWRVCAGERWLVSGSNGSGKTTLLSLITGDNPAAYACDIKVFGQSRQTGENLWLIRQRVAQVSPELQCYFDPAMSAMEAAQSGRYNSYGEERRETPASRAGARFWLAELGFGESAKLPFGVLSSGQQRLVLIARAMVAEPDLLLLDEPCLNLDNAARKIVLDALALIMKQRFVETVICVAHRADEVPRGITRELHLHQPSSIPER